MTEPSTTPDAEPFVEDERHGTHLPYGPASRVPLVPKVLWIAFAVFFVVYMARVYAPDLLRALAGS